MGDKLTPMDVVAGVDSSSHATTVELRVAATGQLISSAVAAHEGGSPTAWWSAFEQAFSMATTGVGSPPIAAISVAATAGMVVLDHDGEVLATARDSADCDPDAGWLMKQLPAGAAGWAQACGSVPTGAFSIAQLSWLHRSDGDLWSRVSRVCLPHDWLTAQLTGSFTTDRGDASRTGYWSASAGYRFDLLAIVDSDVAWSTMLPTVCDPIDVVGTWSGAIVAPGTGDLMATALAVGLGVGDVAVTRMNAFTVSNGGVADPSGSVAGFADANGRFLPTATIIENDTDAAISSLARQFDLDGARMDAPDLVAAGACVQAAATLFRRDPTDVRADWPSEL